METTYLRSIVEHFYRLPYEALDERTVHQVRRCFMDYLGCVIYSAKHRCCQPLVELICDFSPQGTSGPWGSGKRINGAGAGAANACRASSLELDDVSGVNASVHAGVYVWSAAIEAWKVSRCDMKTFIRAIVFGYDVCIRFGMLAGESVRDFGLHGPGMCGSFAAAAAAGMIAGLTARQTEQALCIAGSLLPLCPFVSFIEGADSKDMYGGFGVFQALFAVEAAKRGLTGPTGLLEGPKGIGGFFRLKRGMDIPPGSEYFINSIAFKRFSACFSVHPATTAVLELLAEQDVDPERIARVHVESYPYSYALSRGTEAAPLNAASARLSLPYCTAFALYERGLGPEAFTPESLENGKYRALAEKITIENHEEYGAGPYGVRGSIVTLTMEDGTGFSKEVLDSGWDGDVPDAMLEGKFRALSACAFDSAAQDRLIADLMHLEAPESLPRILAALSGL